METTVRNPLEKYVEWRGNPMYLGIVGGRPMFIVVAADDPNYVITLFPRERG